MVYFSPKSRLVSQKQKPPARNCCKGNESLGGYAGQFGGGVLFRGVPPPFASPPP